MIMLVLVAISCCASLNVPKKQTRKQTKMEVLLIGFNTLMTIKCELLDIHSMPSITQPTIMAPFLNGGGG